ncbi:MAG: hypothetical protein HOV86_02665 [Thermoactinospora sp.]|nr:hypothetical protein [Thermoactinospora sp.]
MNDFTLDEQQLEALRPLAAVIEGAIKDTPIRLGTDDWGTMLAAGILVRVAAYMGGVLPPAAEAGDWLMRGTRDLSIPDQAAAKTSLPFPRPTELLEDERPLREYVQAAEEEGRRANRRDSLLNLLARLQRGGMTAEEKVALRQHVEAEMREADTARSVAAGNKRHVQIMYAELTAAQAAIKRVRTLLAGRWGSVDPDKVRAALDGTEQPTT